MKALIDTQPQIASTMNYAGFSAAKLPRDTPKRAQRDGWFRRGWGGVYVFVTNCVGPRKGFLAELYDAHGHCLTRQRCENALRAADIAEHMLRSPMPS
jgi:hypothetical protein